MQPYYNQVDIVPTKGLIISPVDEALPPDAVSECINFRLTDKPGFYVVRQGQRAFRLFTPETVNNVQSIVFSPYFAEDIGNVWVNELFFKQPYEDIDPPTEEKTLFYQPGVTTVWDKIRQWRDPRTGSAFPFVLLDTSSTTLVDWGTDVLVPAPQAISTIQSNHYPVYSPITVNGDTIPGWSAKFFDRLLLFAQRKSSVEKAHQADWHQFGLDLDIIKWDRVGLTPAATSIYMTAAVGMDETFKQFNAPVSRGTTIVMPQNDPTAIQVGFIHSADWTWISPNLTYLLGWEFPIYADDVVPGSSLEPKYGHLGRTFRNDLLHGDISHLRWKTVVSHPGALQQWVHWIKEESGAEYVGWQGYNIGDYVIYNMKDIGKELQYELPGIVTVQENAAGRADAAVLGFDLRLNNENSLENGVEWGLALYKWYLPRKFGVVLKDKYEPRVINWTQGEPVPMIVRRFVSDGVVAVNEQAAGGSPPAWNEVGTNVYSEAIGARFENKGNFALYLDENWGAKFVTGKKGKDCYRPYVFLNSRAIWGDHRPMITGWTGKIDLGNGFWLGGLSRTLMVDDDDYVFANEDFSVTGFYNLFGDLTLQNPDADPFEITETRGTEYTRRDVYARATDVFVWNEFKIKYYPCSGRIYYPDSPLYLCTHNDRIWNKESVATIRKTYFKEPTDEELYAPVPGWYYRIVFEYDDGSFSNPSVPIAAPLMLWSPIKDTDFEPNKYRRPHRPEVITGAEFDEVGPSWDTPEYLELFSANASRFNYFDSFTSDGKNKIKQLIQDIKEQIYPTGHKILELPHHVFISVYSDTNVLFSKNIAGEGFSFELKGAAGSDVGDNEELGSLDIIVDQANQYRIAYPLITQDNFVTEFPIFTDWGVYCKIFARTTWNCDKVSKKGKFLYWPVDRWKLWKFPGNADHSPMGWAPYCWTIDDVCWGQGGNLYRYNGAGMFDIDPGASDRMRKYYPLNYGNRYTLLMRPNPYPPSNQFEQFIRDHLLNEDSNIRVYQTWDEIKDLAPWEPAYDPHLSYSTPTETNPFTYWSGAERGAFIYCDVPYRNFIQLAFVGGGHTLSPPQTNAKNYTPDIWSDKGTYELSATFPDDTEWAGTSEEEMKGIIWLWPWNTIPAIFEASDWGDHYDNDKVGRNYQLEIFSLKNKDTYAAFWVNIATSQEVKKKITEARYKPELQTIYTVMRYTRIPKERFNVVKPTTPIQVMQRLLVNGVAELELTKDNEIIAFTAERKTFGWGWQDVDAAWTDGYDLKTYEFSLTDSEGITLNIPHLKSRWVPIVPGHTIFWLAHSVEGRLETRGGNSITLYSYEKNAQDPMEYMYDGALWHIWGVHHLFWGQYNDDGDRMEIVCNNRMYLPIRRPEHILELLERLKEKSKQPNGIPLYPNWKKGDYIIPYPFIPGRNIPDPHTNHHNVWKLGPSWHLHPDMKHIRHSTIWQFWNYVSTQVFYEHDGGGDWADDFEVRSSAFYVYDKWKQWYEGDAYRNVMITSDDPDGGNEERTLSYGNNDLWYNRACAGITKPKIYLYIQGERLTLFEQLTMYYTSYHLFGAPRLGLHIDKRLLSPKVKKIHIYRTRSTEADLFNPNEFGYVTTIDVPWKWVIDEEDKTGHWELEEDLYFFDDIPDKAVDYSDNPEKFNALEFGISSTTNIVMNERIYYANYKELYYPLGQQPFVPLWGADIKHLQSPVFRVNEFKNGDQFIRDGMLTPTRNVRGPSLFPGAMVWVSADGAIEENKQQFFLVNVDQSGYYSDVFRSPLLPGRKVLFLPASSDPDKTYKVVFYGLTPAIEDIQNVLVWGTKDIANTPKTLGAVYISDNGTITINYQTPRVTNDLIHEWKWMRTEKPASFPDGVQMPYTPAVITNNESSIRWSDVGYSNVIRGASVENIREGDGGAILALVPTYHGNILAFKRNSIVRLMLAGDFSIARRDQLSENIGILNPQAYAVHGNFVFFASEGGIYVTDDNSIQMISEPINEEYKRRLQYMQNNVPNPAHALVRLFVNPLTMELYINVPIFAEALEYDPQLPPNDGLNEKPMLGTVFVYSINQKVWTTFSYSTLTSVLSRSYAWAREWRTRPGAALVHPILGQSRNYYADSLGRVWAVPIIPSNLKHGGQVYLEMPHEVNSAWYNSIDDYFIEAVPQIDVSGVWYLEPTAITWDSLHIESSNVRAFISSAGIRELLTNKKKVREFAALQSWLTTLPYTAITPGYPILNPFIDTYVRSFMSVRYQLTSSASPYIPDYPTYIAEWDDSSVRQHLEVWVIPGGIDISRPSVDRGEVLRFHYAVEGPAYFKGWRVLLRPEEMYSR
jgi:hypothetical protein